MPDNIAPVYTLDASRRRLQRRGEQDPAPWPAASCKATVLGRFLRKPAELDHALALGKAFDVSREAAIRRYVSLHDECLAAVFSRNRRVRYVEKGEGFPATTVWTGDELDRRLGHQSDDPSPTMLQQVDAAQWLRYPSGVTLFVQTLNQADGYATTLLVAERG